MSSGNLTEREGTNAKNDTLVHWDGHRVRILGQGTDEAGPSLRIEHIWTRPGPMAGPHWHPVLTESFKIVGGRMRFRVDGEDFPLGPRDGVTVRPRQVHQFRNAGEERLVLLQEVRPPGHHKEMFELWHRLDQKGKTSRRGVPTNPLALGLL